MTYPIVNPQPMQVPEPITYYELKSYRDLVSQLLSQYVTSNLLAHLLATEVVMYELANFFQETNQAEHWALAGLIHDLDWDACDKNPQLHCSQTTRQWLLENGLPETLIDDAFSHYGYVIINGQKLGFDNLGTQIEANTLLRQTLFAADELTGFIKACALVRPSKSIVDLETKSVLKKLKDKSFAAQVNRDLIKTCEITLGLSLAEFVDLVLKAMQKYQPFLESVC